MHKLSPGLDIMISTMRGSVRGSAPSGLNLYLFNLSGYFQSKLRCKAACTRGDVLFLSCVQEQFVCTEVFGPGALAIYYKQSLSFTISREYTIITSSQVSLSILTLSFGMSHVTSLSSGVSSGSGGSSLRPSGGPSCDTLILSSFFGSCV